jgi:hypothetical protein
MVWWTVFQFPGFLIKPERKEGREVLGDRD